MTENYPYHAATVWHALGLAYSECRLDSQAAEFAAAYEALAGHPVQDYYTRRSVYSLETE